ncbi:MAG: RNA polymerase sigma factor [Bacteroidota bacterium]
MEIIERILSGDQKAMQTLYQRHERVWFRLCLRYARNRSDAQDILQEGLIQIFRDLHQFDDDRGAFSNWSNRVLVNAALRYLRKYQWQNSFDDLEIIRQEPVLNESAIDQLSAHELTQLIQQLPTGYRVVFNMYVMEGYNHREIAETLNISEGTSKSQLHKAKKLLRQQIESLF